MTSDSVKTLIDRMEMLIHRDVGRGMQAVFHATQGGLWSAASALAASKSPKVGLITGFFVPSADPPAAETDGPAGAALMAKALVHAGLACRLATDTICHAACRVALDTAGAGSVPIDVVSPGASVSPLVDLWRQEGIDWVIAIERCGPSADGLPRNMRGTDMSIHAAPLDQLFSAGPWRTVAIGDGGNETGMGCVARPLIARHVPLGEIIGCVVPADFLISAGVSHWGAYAMLAAMTLLRPDDWSAAMVMALDPVLERTVLEAMVRNGPAVDGVSLRHEATIDALDLAVHQAVMQALLAIVTEHQDHQPVLYALHGQTNGGG